MKKCIFLFFFLLVYGASMLASELFRFAVFTDLHISVRNEQPSDDLKNAVDDVNKQHGIDFVLIAGDVTESGDSASLRLVQKVLDGLTMPYYITTGNHDVASNEVGNGAFISVFGSDTFSFLHKGFRFIGFPTTPFVKGGNGYIQPKYIEWVGNELEKQDKDIPVFALTHYPLLTGDVDNWSDMIKLLLQYNVKAVLGGHYHRNVIFNYDDIPGVIHRSTLRAGESVGGYSVWTVNTDAAEVMEKIIGEPGKQWLILPLNNNE